VVVDTESGLRAQAVRLGLWALAGAILLASVAGMLLDVEPARSKPAGATDFVEEIAIDGLDEPTDVEFAPDGRVLVAEKRGVVKLLDGLSDDSAEVLADLRTQVHSAGDRGLIGLAVRPDDIGLSAIWVSYVYDAPPGGAAPTFGAAGESDDSCPADPPEGACVVSGRVSKLVVEGDRVVGERVLLEDWCLASLTHTVDSVDFGPDGALYVSGGDGSFREFADEGQQRTECDDPDGGSLRAQGLRTAGGTVGLSGTIVRVAPDTGEALPDNPLATTSDPNARRIVAFGLRNPFRFAFRPGTNELWIGDVGWNSFEEIDRLVDPAGDAPANFGWPCFEGPERQPEHEALRHRVCEDLYADGSATPPFYSYHLDEPFVRDGACDVIDTGVISGLAFYDGGPYPDEYDNALFFGDWARGCLVVMYPGPDGVPDPDTLTEFRSGLYPLTDLEVGPDGTLYYVDIGGAVRRLRYVGGVG
jgi:glucose/arabinose dehydrogenase